VTKSEHRGGWQHLGESPIGAALKLMCVFLPHLAASSLDKLLGYKVASHASGPKVANPPSPVTPLVETDAPAVQKGQAVAASAKYDAIRHPTAHEATVRDTEVSSVVDRDNPSTHQPFVPDYKSHYFTFSIHRNM
jgi:hypothetical protein